MTGSKRHEPRGYQAPIEEYVSNMPYLTFVGQGYHRGYRYGNPYSEFTVEGPNGPYIDCVYDPLFAEIDEQINTSIRLVSLDQTPVIATDEWHLNVAGKRVYSYPSISTIGGILRYEFTPGKVYAKSAEDFHKEYFADREPDPLELMYPHSTEILKVPDFYQDWVWDAIEKVFPKYVEYRRPKLVVHKPINVGTIGHIDFGNNSLIANFVRLAQATTSDEKWRAATGLIVNHGYRLERRPDPNVGAIGDVVYPTLRVEPRGF